MAIEIWSQLLWKPDSELSICETYVNHKQSKFQIIWDAWSGICLFKRLCVTL